jgi:predicted anti-sigma-YlaC factor YlaD
MKLLQAHLLTGLLMIVVTAAAVALQADRKSATPATMLVAFVVWSVVPVTLAMASGWLLRKSRAALVSCLLGQSAAFALMAALFVLAFYIRPDAQAGLIFIFGPVYPLGLLIPFGVAALFFHFRSRRADSIVAGQ